MTFAVSSLVTAAVNWASVETVVVVPPLPPVVLWRLLTTFHSIVKLKTYPPFWVAYPVVAISVMAARLPILARSTTPSSIVGLGTAAASWERRLAPREKKMNFIVGFNEGQWRTRSKKLASVPKPFSVTISLYLSTGQQASLGGTVPNSWTFSLPSSIKSFKLNMFVRYWHFEQTVICGDRMTWRMKQMLGHAKETYKWQKAWKNIK